MSTFVNMDSALPVMAFKVLTDGREVGSRLGEHTLELLHQQITLEVPWQREILVPTRNANIAAQIAETMWVLSGRSDVEWLSRYLPRAAEFSDDGKVWRGAYGPRLRNYGGYPHQDNAGRIGIDQIRHVVDLLAADRSNRRAVVSIYDPLTDSTPGKDIPCNDFLSFISRDGSLDLSVFVRSNDLIWGWSGINAFEWSALQEIIAGLLGLKVGSLVFNTTSLHIYDRHWRKAHKIHEQHAPVAFEDSPRFSGSAVHNLSETPEHPIDNLDMVIAQWFDMEKRLRKGGFLEGEVEMLLDQFPEPMLQSWLRVLAWYWSGHEEYLRPLEGTRLWAAVQETPQSIQKQAAPRGYLVVGTPSGASGEYLPGDTVDVYPTGKPEVFSTTGLIAPLAHKTTFVQFIDDLHREKSAAYGDSWKRRGEQMSILANIARKVDRLDSGKSTEDETSADTAIDLLVYLVKYRLWLSEQHPALNVIPFNPLASEDNAVREVLNYLDRIMTPEAQSPAALYVQYILDWFARLEDEVGVDPLRETPEGRVLIAEGMIMHAFPLARLLWEKENGHDHAARNATRSWNPDA